MLFSLLGSIRFAEDGLVLYHLRNTNCSQFLGEQELGKGQTIVLRAVSTV